MNHKWHLWEFKIWKRPLITRFVSRYMYSCAILCHQWILKLKVLSFTLAIKYLQSKELSQNLPFSGTLINFHYIQYFVRVVHNIQRFIHLVRTKNFPKTKVSSPLINTCTCTYQRGRSVSFAEYFAYVLYEKPHT